MSKDDDSTIRLTDPRAMRALAHPLRLRLLGELRIRGPQSVGMLSEALDEAPGSISYHVGKLAQFGFVEEAPELARDKRERWWRTAHQQTSFEPLEMLADPERRAASNLLRRTISEVYAENLDRYLEAEATLPPEWVGAATAGDAIIHLTSDELGELRDELLALVDRWRAHSDPERAGAEPVSLIYHAFRRADR
jgi:DNA-binding transcriptional ArsR family regulator